MTDSWSWPTWVPTRIREELESFWSYHGNYEGWRKSSETNHAPAFGKMVTAISLGPGRRQVTGRFIFAWNNICRIVHDDGTYDYASFHYRDRVKRIRIGVPI